VKEMYRLAVTWLLGVLGFLVAAGGVMAVALWVRQRGRKGGDEDRLGSDRDVP
jgi:hypothetical protein